MTGKKVVYLDHHASTPCDPRVLEAMLPYFSTHFGNPSSTNNSLGRNAADAVDRAREEIADALGVRRSEIIFTSGASESNNLALLGLSRQAGVRRQIITTAIEHKSVLETCRALSEEGFEITVLPVEADGRLDLARLKAAVSEKTLVVTVQAANNEIGTLQDVSAIADITHESGALLHCDAAQAIGKIPFSISDLGVDLLSASAHKLYGPKGIGFLFLAGGVRKLPIGPIQFGGGHESGLRPGTLNVPAIVGFAKAVSLIDLSEKERIQGLRERFEARILRSIPGMKINGAGLARLAGNSSITIPGIDAEALLANLPELALSTGSACTSGAPDPSHVLTAIGLSRANALSTIRVGFGRENTAGEVDFAADKIAAAVARIQALSIA
jgi:cysteine desulfurase